jgi:glycerol-3-phosphate acyltransferase PlsY
MIYPVFILIFGYLLGSIPWGYIVVRLTTGKNILSIGWRKTSGSNVFWHVGKGQGAIVGILDVLKGYLAVFIAQKLGGSIPIQILSGFFSVLGHNWSIFLKFAGGRGIGTFFGATLFLSPKVALISLIFFILFTFILNSPVSTFLFLGSYLVFSPFFDSFYTVGALTLISLPAILFKRLSPINEIFPLKEKKSIIKNRLLYDRDEKLPLRISQYFKW